MSAIEQNIMTFHKLCGRLGDRSEAVTRLVEAMAVQISTAPASTRTVYHDSSQVGWSVIPSAS